MSEAISREEAILLAEGAFKPAHTYSSENAETYRIYDNGQRRAISYIVDALRSLPSLAPPADAVERANVALRAAVEIAEMFRAAENGWRTKPTRYEIQDWIAKHIDVVPVDNHVAWCRYTYDESGSIASIVTCDSDAKGAFKVYRALAAHNSRPQCGVANPGGVPCTKDKGHPAGHDEGSYGPLRRITNYESKRLR